MAIGISGAELKLLLREKANRFLHFAHNKETGQFFGKTCKGWGVLLDAIANLLVSVTKVVFMN